MTDRQTGSEDDEFGLPDVRLRPRTGSDGGSASADSVPAQPRSSIAESDSAAIPASGGGNVPDEPESGWEASGGRRVLYILIPILTVLLGLKGYFYLHVAPDKMAELEQTQKQVITPVVPEPTEPAKTDSVPAKPAKPATAILTEPTGRFHVVIKSALDKETIMKEAGQLNERGIECLVIPANSTSPSNRLVLFSTENLQQAQVKADSLRPAFGAGIWVLKY